MYRYFRWAYLVKIAGIVKRWRAALLRRRDYGRVARLWRQRGLRGWFRKALGLLRLRGLRTGRERRELVARNQQREGAPQRERRRAPHPPETQSSWETACVAEKCPDEPRAAQAPSSRGVRSRAPRARRGPSLARPNHRTRRSSAREYAGRRDAGGRHSADSRARWRARRRGAATAARAAATAARAAHANSRARPAAIPAMRSGPRLRRQHEKGARFVGAA